jgi:hypothetical protein
MILAFSCDLTLTHTSTNVKCALKVFPEQKREIEDETNCLYLIKTNT